MRVFGTLQDKPKQIYMDKKKEIENQTRVVATPSQVLNSILAEYDEMKKFMISTENLTIKNES